MSKAFENSTRIKPKDQKLALYDIFYADAIDFETRMSKLNI
jgi:hypothetical protein